jgi:hypothetical protein
MRRSRHGRAAMAAASTSPWAGFPGAPPAYFLLFWLPCYVMMLIGFSSYRYRTGAAGSPSCRHVLCRWCRCPRGHASLGNRGASRGHQQVRADHLMLPRRSSPPVTTLAGWNRPPPRSAAVGSLLPWPGCYWPSSVSLRSPTSAGGHAGARAALLRHRRPPTSKPRELPTISALSVMGGEEEGHCA